MRPRQQPWRKYFTRFAQLCPNAPVVLEIISGFSKPFPYLKRDFWKQWPAAKATDFAGLVAMAATGKPMESHRSPDKAAEQAYQKAELERSVQFFRSLQV